MKKPLICISVLFVLCCCSAASCLPQQQSAALYATELEACAVQSSTCLGYVMCRQRVTAQHGRPIYNGKCAP